MFGTLETLIPGAFAGSPRPVPVPGSAPPPAPASPPPAAERAPDRPGDGVRVQLSTTAMQLSMVAEITAPPRPGAPQRPAGASERSGDGVRVQFSAAAMQLSISAEFGAPPRQAPQTPVQQNPAVAPNLSGSVGRATREANRQFEALMDKLREDLTKAFRLLGRSEEESLKAAEAVAGKAREKTESQPAPPASFSGSMVFQSVSVRFESGSGRVEASIEMVRLEIGLTAGQALLGGGGEQQVDPLVLDMDGNGIDLTTAENGVLFDIDADGKRDRSAWVAGNDALLALDRNGNGRIDDGRELFGEQNGASGGFAELAKFDADGNGRIDASDVVFHSLILLHGDGRKSRLSDAGITEIRLDMAIPVNERLAGGTMVAQSDFGRADGSRGRVADVLLDVRI